MLARIKAYFHKSLSTTADQSWVCQEDLQRLVEQSSEAEALFEVPIVPNSTAMSGLFCVPEPDAREELVACTVSQRRYRMQENYKIELVPTQKGFESQRYYLSDFAQMVRAGRIRLLKQPQHTKIAWAA